MAKKSNAVYAPGELDKVRGKLGVDDDEAKRMAQILGGEVGVEKDTTPDAGKSKGRVSRETVSRGGGAGAANGVSAATWNWPTMKTKQARKKAPCQKSPILWMIPLSS